MKAMKKIVQVSVAASLMLLAATAVWLWKPMPEAPSFQELSEGSQHFRAEILRDVWGVPHIVGLRNSDTSFGLAYAHAEDDFETIQETVAATRGVLARYRGRVAAPTDYMVQLMDVWGTVSRHYEGVPADIKEIAEAYAAGINLYAAENPESTWLGLPPFTAEDVVAGFVFKTPFFYGLDKPLLNLFDESTQLELALAPTSTTSAWTVSDQASPERGSNALAVSAKRSTDNSTRLLINSHQPMTGPVAWYEAHLHAQTGWKIQGGVFPGTPVILHGFTENLGWANTVNHIDLSDEYLLTLNPENSNQYLLDGKWYDFESKEVTLLVKLWSNFRFPAKRTVLRSQHGPVIKVNGKAYALRYAGMDEIGQLEQYARLNQATNLAEFMQAMSLQQLPSINYVYADKESNIGFIHNAQYPDRLEGWDWSKGLPGDRSDLIWQGYRSFSQVPKLMNPSSGLVFNANNTPFSATDGDDNLRPENFPQSMGLARNQTNRSWRFIELNDGVTPLSEAEILKQKFDVEYSERSDYLLTLNKVMVQNWSDSDLLLEAQSLIKAWNRQANIENRHTAIAISVLRELHANKDKDDRSPQVLRAATERAAAYLTQNYGRLDPLWGEVNRLQRGDFNQPVSGGPDALRAIYSLGYKPDEKAYATAGDTWMALIAWDQNGKQDAKVLHQFGSATLDMESPHYSDQAELFVTEQWRNASFDIDQIRSSASRNYVIGNPKLVD